MPTITFLPISRMVERPFFLIARLLPEAEALCSDLRSVGVPCASFPLFDILPVCPPHPSYPSYDYGVFLSRTAVSSWFSQPVQSPFVQHWLAPGPGTAQLMREKGLPCVTQGEETGSDAIRFFLHRDADLANRRVLLIRGVPTRNDFLLWLTQQGCIIDDLVCYERHLRLSWEAALQSFMAVHKNIVWVLTSSETARIVGSSRHTLSPPEGVRFSFLCGHPRIEDVVKSYGLRPVFLTTMNKDSLFQAIQSLFQGHQTE